MAENNNGNNQGSGDQDYSYEVRYATLYAELANLNKSIGESYQKTGAFMDYSSVINHISNSETLAAEAAFLAIPASGAVQDALLGTGVCAAPFPLGEIFCATLIMQMAITTEVLVNDPSLEVDALKSAANTDEWIKHLDEIGLKYTSKELEHVIEVVKELSKTTDRLIELGDGRHATHKPPPLDTFIDTVKNLFNTLDKFRYSNPDWISSKSWDHFIDTASSYFIHLFDKLNGTGHSLGQSLPLSDKVYDFFVLAQKWVPYVPVDPLALDLDNDGIETTAINGWNGVLFDHNNDGVKTATGWLKGDDGFLVLDRNGNGTIDNGGELFGDNTKLGNGVNATDGFAALADVDTNYDQLIDSNDGVFPLLKVWQDLNQDGISQANELKTLTELGITSLSTESVIFYKNRLINFTSSV